MAPGGFLGVCAVGLRIDQVLGGASAQCFAGRRGRALAGGMPGAPPFSPGASPAPARDRRADRARMVDGVQRANHLPLRDARVRAPVLLLHRPAGIGRGHAFEGDDAFLHRPAGSGSLQLRSLPALPLAKKGLAHPRAHGLFHRGARHHSENRRSLRDVLDLGARKARSRQ